MSRIERKLEKRNDFKEISQGGGWVKLQDGEVKMSGEEMREIVGEG